MYTTQVRSTRDLRNHFADIQQMLENHERVVITNNGRGAAVIINFEDYAAYEEYMHEKTVSERLEKALKSLHDPSVRLIPQDEVWAKLESKWGVK